MLVSNARCGISLDDQAHYSADKVRMLYQLNQQLDAREALERLSQQNLAFAGGDGAQRLAEHYERVADAEGSGLAI